ncbi:MAG TPA: hypothetical protein PLA90_17985, partial [Candidatus Sumerlaeota bacterium]|nr:hypothetical protein [Candidatus Sumerlaeota bacterium]
MFRLQRGLRVFSFFLFALLCSTTVHALPSTISIQGALTGSDGQALTGVRVWRVQFYNAEVGGGTLGSAITGVFLIETPGRFSIELTPPAEVLAAPGEVWYELAVDSATPPDAAIDPGDIFPKRVAVHSVLFAQRAVVAQQSDRATTATLALNALHASMATTATVALNALTLGGVPVNELASDTELTSGLAAKADRGHSHRLDALDGAVTDAQVPDTITIKLANEARIAETANVAYQLRGEAFLMVRTTANPVTNASNLLKTYAEAKELTPHKAALSATNRAVVLVPPGRYDLGTASLLLDAECVDLEGVSNDCEKQYLYGTTNGPNTGVLMQTANNVRIENLLVECTLSTGTRKIDHTDPAAYFPNTALAATRVRNCRFQCVNISYSWSMRLGVEYKGTYEGCTGGDYAFGGVLGTASGIFRECKGEQYSFGRAASGTFTNCTGEDYAFGSGGTASGTFTNCTGGFGAFGGKGTASGIFRECKGEQYSFGQVA